MRVGMLINGYYPRIGGAERVLSALAPCLQKLNAEIHILTKRHPGLNAFERIDGVPVHRLPIPGPKVVASASFTLNALILIKKLAPDILHVHELGATARTAVIAQRLWGTPVAVTIHRSGPLGPIRQLRRKLFGPTHLEYYLQNIDGFVVISQEINKELETLGIPPEQRYYVPNGVDTNRFKPLLTERKLEMREVLGLSQAPVVVFTGRLDPEKRVHHLVNIWPEVREAFSEALLLLVGDGSERETLHKLAGDGVRFEGSVDDVVPYLQASDVFVLPSVAEGLSVAALEAQSTGLPVLMTEVGGASDMIDHGRNGWLIPPDDPDALKMAVLRLLRDDNLRAQLGHEARRRVKHEYALSAIAARLRTVYFQLSTKNVIEKPSHQWKSD